jgi:hypothetical protein
MSLQVHLRSAPAMTDILMKNRFPLDTSTALSASLEPASHQGTDSTLRVFPAHSRLGQFLPLPLQLLQQSLPSLLRLLLQ